MTPRFFRSQQQKTGPAPSTAPQSETRTQEPARCRALSRPPRGTGKPEWGDRGREQSAPLSGSPAPPASRKESLRTLPQINDRFPASTDPTGRPLDYLRNAEHRGAEAFFPPAHPLPPRTKKKRLLQRPQPWRAEARTETCPRRRAKRPSALRPSQQRRAHLHGLACGTRQRDQQRPAAAPPQAPLFLLSPRRGAVSRQEGRKTAPQRCPPGVRLPNRRLPAAATAPSGVSGVAAGVSGVRGGGGGSSKGARPRGGATGARPRCGDPGRLPVLTANSLYRVLTVCAAV